MGTEYEKFVYVCFVMSHVALLQRIYQSEYSEIMVLNWVYFFGCHVFRRKMTQVFGLGIYSFEQARRQD